MFPLSLITLLPDRKLVIISIHNIKFQCKSRIILIYFNSFLFMQSSELLVYLQERPQYIFQKKNEIVLYQMNTDWQSGGPYEVIT